MQTRAHRPARPAVGSTTGPGLLQRKCSCGGRCASCSKRRLDRKAVGRTSELPVASRIVHEVLVSPGRPLGERLRHELEPQFGHDFSGVRVHDDARADESCRAVGRRGLHRGRAHRIRRGQVPARVARGASPPGPRAGARRPAGRGTRRRWRRRPGDHAARRRPGARGRQGRRAGAPGRPDRPPDRPIPPPPAPATGRPDHFSCGVEVTDLVKGAVKDAKAAFAGWDEDDKIESCQALSSLTSGDIAWDISSCIAR